MKKKLLIGISYVLLMTLALTATVAYFTDTDSAVNVMTVGNIDIEQLEYQRAEGVPHNAGEAGAGNGVKEGALVPFKQGQTLLPAYPMDDTAYTAETDDMFYWGDYVYSGTAANGLWNDEKLGNVMDKMVFVKNTGKNNAYYRTIIAFECPEGMEYSEGFDKEFMMNVNMSKTAYEWKGIGYTNIDGVRYLLMEATYLKVLEPGNTAHPSLLQVVMTHNVEQEDAAKLGNTYEILVYTQAVQADMGVEDMTAEKALDAAFGDISVANHPWLNTVLVQTNDEAELLNALTSGKDVIVNTDIVEIDDAAFDGNGTTVTLAGVGDGAYGYLGFVPAKGEDTKVENINVTGSGFVEVGHHGEGGGNYIINSLTVKEMNATLAVANGSDKVAAAFAHYGTATLNNCVMTGTTTGVDGYAASDVYDAGFVNGTKTTINGGEYGSFYVWNQAHVTVNGAKIGRIRSTAITTNNLGMLTIGAGTTVDVIELNPGNKYSPALTIEEGATVGAIVYNGVTYTQAEWLAK